MKIQLNIDKENLDSKNHSLVISDLTTGELDQFRILLQTLLKYGQFNSCEYDLNDLGSESIIKQMCKKKKPTKIDYTSLVEEMREENSFTTEERKFLEETYQSIVNLRKFKNTVE